MSRRDARVLMLSERNLESPRWQVGNYELEDVVGTLDDVRLLAPSGVAPSALKEAARQTARWVRHLPESRAKRVMHSMARHARRPELFTYPAMVPTPVTGDYSLFFAAFMFPTDIVHTLQLKGWRERCEKAVCYLNELWGHEVELLAPYLKLLGQVGFDHVFVVNAAQVDVVSEISGVPCSFLAPGIDARSASPFPDPPPRTVDFFQFGRRSDITHQAALELSRTDRRFYLYDTLVDVQLPDHRTHREQMNSILQRSRYCFAYRNADALEWARGEDVLAPRYFEGVAGGAIMLGSAPRIPQFGEYFDWPDAVVEIPYEAHDLRGIIAGLDAQPARLAAAQTANVVNSLRRHDWVYRWQQILDAANLPATPRMAERIEHLGELARLAEGQTGPSRSPSFT